MKKMNITECFLHFALFFCTRFISLFFNIYFTFAVMVIVVVAAAARIGTDAVTQNVISCYL